MRRELRALYDASPFAVENLSFRETLSLIYEKNGLSREDYFLEREIDEGFFKKIKSDFERALSGEPLGYILGRVPFFESDFFVEEGVLIPRRDSEVLVERAIEHLPQGSRFLDICTGSGCLGISVLKRRGDTRATLIDISKTALKVAEKNASALGVIDRCEIKKINLFKCQPSTLEPFDTIIMNPPYITKKEMEALPENVKREPRLALFGGEDGLDFYREVKRLFPEGKTLIFEIGHAQGDALVEMFGGGEIIKDASGADRVFLKK